MKWLLLYDKLYEIYGDCRCPLVHASPFQLLAAVMLSAQCRDERVNQVTEKLFALAPDAPSMAALDEEKIAEIIKPCGLHASKSVNLKGAAQMIVESFEGKVPETMEELIKLPGIGRKSANVILGNAFGIPGFPVDTHVNRVLNRLGVTDSGNPEVIEKEVCQNIDSRYWTNFSHLLINHGRKHCPARNYNCTACPLKNCCSTFSGKGDL